MYTPPRKKGPRSNKPKFTGKIRLRVGDTVRVIAGKDTGKEGKITRVLPSQGKVVVEGINIIIKHQKPRPQAQSNMGASAPHQGRVELSAPLYASKVQLVDSGKGNAVTRIGVRIGEDGNRVRYAKKSGSVIQNG